MNAPTSSSAGAEKLLSSVEAEISRLVEQKTRNPTTQIEADPERIKAAIARLTSNSIDGLEGLMSELQQLQAFLKGEVERVRGGNRKRIGWNKHCNRDHCSLETVLGAKSACPRVSRRTRRKY